MNTNDWKGGGPVWNAIFAVWGIALAAQIALLFLLPVGRVRWLVFAGWGVFGVSAVLGWVPIFLFRRRGRVAKGSAYIRTTQLVTSGLYAFARHPQYLAGDYIAVAVMCITQHWATFVAGTVAIIGNRLSMLKADRGLIEKFGEPYREYMERVPRASLLIGFVRWIQRCRRQV
jgi:protein-S-isoprenylcysteine O-methyltransferase Ste14